MIEKNKLIAHRGIHNSYVVENTLSAFSKCIEEGYAIELDVRLSKDKKIIVYHDVSLTRLAKINRFIEDCTLAEIRKVKLKNKYSIPTLHQVLNLVDGKVPIYIDVKGNIGNNILEQELLNLLTQYRGEFFIQSFNPKTIKWLKKHTHKYKCGLIIFNYPQYNFIKKLFLHVKTDFVVCKLSSLHNYKIQKIRKNKTIIGWTIKNGNEIVKYQEFCDKMICENI